MIEDTVLREFRAQWTDMAARVPFTASGDEVHDSRKYLEDQVYQEVRQQAKVNAAIGASAKALQASVDTFDVG